MDENMKIVGTESTTSTAAMESTDDSAVAQETVDTTVGTDDVDVGEGTTPPTATGDGTAQEAENTAGGETSFLLPVQFNHESRELNMEEAREYAQKGMQLESMAPMLDKMRTIAAAQNISMKDMVDNLWGAFERSHRQEILERVGGNEEAADALMEKKRSEWNTAFETAKSTERQAEADSRKALENRLLEGYTEIREVFPGEYPEFKNIPQAVINDAIKNNRGLLDALLRYRHKEGGKVEQNKQAQARAAGASVGSQVDKPSADPMLDDIERAFFTALG